VPDGLEGLAPLDAFRQGGPNLCNKPLLILNPGLKLQAVLNRGAPHVAYNPGGNGLRIRR
jgi:hypothetical protein